MSTHHDVSDTDVLPDPKLYQPGTGADRYARFAADFLHVTRTYVLDTILKALEENQQVVVLGGNGVGKSFFVGVGGLSSLYCNPHTIVHVTAGTSTTLKNNIWKPTRGLFNDAKDRWGEDVFPGRTLDGTREIRTEIADKWYFECVSARYPGDLEGPHNEHVIYFIEEAEKSGITDEHIDSVRSTATDRNDRVCVVANPPTDDGDIVAQLVDSDEWTTLRLPSWDSHNVRIDRGLDDGDTIGGLATTYKIKQDWNGYHEAEDWPGLEQAIEWSSPYLDVDGNPVVSPEAAATDWHGNPKENPAFRTDLHERWYKRRASIIPPQSSETWRPFSVEDVKAAYNRSIPEQRVTPTGVGIDVARSGDQTVMSGVHQRDLPIHYAEQGDNHTKQGPKLRDIIDDWPEPMIAVDAVGEGSGLADDIDDWFPNVTRFKANSVAAQPKKYEDMWAEGLQLLGDFLEEGSYSNTDLRDQLLTAARTVTFSRKHIKSRGNDGADVVAATSKEEVKEAHGSSPDFLDSAVMALWADEHGGQSNSKSRVFDGVGQW